MRDDDLFLQQQVLQASVAPFALPSLAELAATRTASAPTPLDSDHPALQRMQNARRAWADGMRLIASRTALQLDAANNAHDAAVRERAQRWCRFVAPVLMADGSWQSRQAEGSPEVHAVDLLVHQVLPDAGAAFAACLLDLRDELDASRENEADTQRRMAQLRYLGTSIALAAKADPQLPGELAADYLRAATLTLLAWAWARIERVAPPDDQRWTAPARAFRRWVLPEFDMRVGIIKRACESATPR